MERSKGNLVFPTSVYLDNLASTGSSVGRSQISSGTSSPSVSEDQTSVNMFEVRRGKSF